MKQATGIPLPTQKETSISLHNVGIEQPKAPISQSKSATQQRFKPQSNPRKKNWFKAHPNAAMLVFGCWIPIIGLLPLAWGLRQKNRSLGYLLFSWIIILSLESRPEGSYGILTNEQVDAGLSLKTDGDFLNLLKNGGFVTSFHAKGTQKATIKSEAEKYLVTHMPEQPRSASVGQCPYCGEYTAGKTRGVRGNKEGLLFILLFLLFVIPGLIYYIYIETVPYCANCKRRVRLLERKAEKYPTTPTHEQPRSADMDEYPFTPIPEQPRSADMDEYPFTPIPEQPRSADTAECPYCGNYTVGTAKGLRGGNEPLVFFLLFLLLFIPGIVYYIHMGNVPYCSSCGQRVRK